MTRQEHLDWSKQRAIELAEQGDLNGAFASFASDVTKHDETASLRQVINSLGMPLLIMGALSTPAKMIDHIKGYN